MTWQGHDRGTTAYRRILVALFGAGVATFAQLYSPQALLPFIAADLGVSAAQSSLVISAATLGLAVGVLPWSLIADRIGRVKAMRIALITATIIGLLFPWVPWFESVIALRFVQGVALGGIPGVAIVYLTEEIRIRYVTLAAGTYISGTTIGGLLGRFTAAPIAELTDWRLGSTSVAIVSVVMVAISIALTPTPRGFTTSTPSVAQVARAIMTHMRDPRLLVIYGQAFLLMGAFVAVYNYFLFRVESPPFGITPGVASLMYLAYLAGTVSSRMSGLLIQRFGIGRPLVGGILVMALGTLMTLSESLTFMILGLVVLTGGFFAAHAIAVGWSSTRAPEHRAQSTALYNFWYYSGSSVFGYLGGFAWAFDGWLGVVMMVLILIAGAGFLAMMSVRQAP